MVSRRSALPRVNLFGLELRRTVRRRRRRHRALVFGLVAELVRRDAAREDDLAALRAFRPRTDVRRPADIRLVVFVRRVPRFAVHGREVDDEIRRGRQVRLRDGPAHVDGGVPHTAVVQRARDVRCPRRGARRRDVRQHEVPDRAGLEKMLSEVRADEAGPAEEHGRVDGQFSTSS